MHTAIFLYCCNAWYDNLHMQNKNEALWRRVMQVMSPNHACTIIFVFDIAKSTRVFFSFSYENFWTKFYARLPRARHCIFPLSPSLIIHRNYITFTLSSVFNCYFYELFNLNFKFFDKNLENIQLILAFTASLWPI